VVLRQEWQESQVLAVVFPVEQEHKRRKGIWFLNMNKSIKIIALCAVVTAIVGCGGGSSSGGGGTTAATTPPASTTATAATYKPNVEAGFPIAQSPDDPSYHQLVAASEKYGHRADPFSLTKEEQDYDRTQNAERIMASMGWATDEHQEKVDNVQPPVLEEQPYRRLAGIIVGDSVLALIDMGGGQTLQVIRPGQQIEGTPWTVVSIDQDKAVLHRDGNVAPHTVTVRLETPPGGVGGGGSTGFSGGPGAPAGAPPGGNQKGKGRGMGGIGIG
jgi:hypothetical protein